MAQLDDALKRLSGHGTVTLAGRAAGPVERWLRVRRTAIGASLGAAALGVICAVGGVALRDVDAWALLVVVGGFLSFAGIVAAAATWISTRMWSGRLRAEREPVVIDRTGITLRGIGPVPWSGLSPPEHRRIVVKNDIGGFCAVMPLTAQGIELVRQQPGWWQLRVGPRPYLHWRVPCLLLPGIEGLSEDETMRLFALAHQRFAL